MSSDAAHKDSSSTGSSKEAGKRKHENKPFIEFLERTTIQTVLKERRKRHEQVPGSLVTLDHNTRVSDALDELAEHAILSAPVVLSASVEDTESDTYLGIADVHSLLTGLFQELSEKHQTAASVTTEALKEVSKAYGDRKLITMTGHDVELRYRGSSNEPLHELIVTGFLGASEAREVHHRLALFNERGRVTTIISMSDIVHFIDKHQDKLGKFADKTAEELGWAAKMPCHVSDKATVLQAFEQMAKYKVPSVAVVDEHGRYVDNLSESDLRGLRHADLERLLLPVTDFVKRENKKLHDHTLVKPSATLSHMLHKFTSGHAHRLWIVDEDQKLKGVVSQTDVLRAVVA